MGNRLNISKTTLMNNTARSNAWTLGIASAHPAARLHMTSTDKIGSSPTFTSGPAAMLHRVAPGRGGGSTNATPPSGQSTIRFALPPTWRQASAWPNSWSNTIRNSARYSSTFQVIEEYFPARALISNTATTNQDQCKNTSMSAKRNRWIDPWRALGIYEIYNTGCLAPSAPTTPVKQGKLGHAVTSRAVASSTPSYWPTYNQQLTHHLYRKIFYPKELYVNNRLLWT